ncbi:MAG: alpha-hydroxy acid oxidase, partial [Thermoanaerobaculia bacterium]|nr:alpha-hydroxy acid oxidase [Thermoanaerobaculia bacterium]
MAVEHMQTLQEIVRAARANLGQGDWDYLIGGADTEAGVRRNRGSIEALALRPRVLRDVAEVDTSAELLGQRLRIPVFLPPIGSVQVFEAGGAASVARAAERFGTLQFVSSACQPDIEETASASAAPKVYQLYLAGDDAWIDARIERAIAAGYVGFCLTVDTQVYSRRERDLLKRYVPLSGRLAVESGALDAQARMTWELVDRIKARFDIPLVLKGVATAEDAAIACDHGVDLIYVSNHGGRQLDHTRGTIDVLPEVVAEVGGRAQIAVDGGFLRGTDVLKAIALGADAVGVGRLECFGQAAGGADGVVRALEILEH